MNKTKTLIYIISSIALLSFILSGCAQTKGLVKNNPGKNSSLVEKYESRAIKISFILNGVSDKGGKGTEFNSVPFPKMPEVIKNPEFAEMTHASLPREGKPVKIVIKKVVCSNDGKIKFEIKYLKRKGIFEFLYFDIINGSSEDYAFNLFLKGANFTSNLAGMTKINGYTGLKGVLAFIPPLNKTNMLIVLNIKSARNKFRMVSKIPEISGK